MDGRLARDNPPLANAMKRHALFAALRSTQQLVGAAETPGERRKWKRHEKRVIAELRALEAKFLP